MNEWLWQTAADLGRGIDRKEIDPVALTRVYLDAIAAHPFKDRIYACVTADRAMAEAQAASDRAKLGQRLSMLDGVPISWKDLFDSAGSQTEAGTALLAGRVPDADAVVLRYATQAGLVCLGKTHMSEIAFSGLGLNPVTATSPCVNDHDAVSGGSSSGAAASVAFGLAAAAIGSDTGGSVRIPSAWNDLVGLKTTHGRLSLTGVVPLCKSFDTVGHLCRSVEDAALIDAALMGRKPADLRGADLTGIRFLISETIMFDGIDNTLRLAFERAVSKLELAGAIVERAEVPAIEAALSVAKYLYAPEAYAEWRDLVEAEPEKMFACILERVQSGKTTLAHDFIAAWDVLRAQRDVYAKATAGFDAVIFPSAPIMPPKVNRLMSDPTYYEEQNLLALRNTRPGNMLDLCSLTLPLDTPSTGILLNAPANQEERLLRLGVAVERALAEMPQS